MHVPLKWKVKVGLNVCIPLCLLVSCHEYDLGCSHLLYNSQRFRTSKHLVHLSDRHHVFIYLECFRLVTNFGTCHLISCQSQPVKWFFFPIVSQADYFCLCCISSVTCIYHTFAEETLWQAVVAVTGCLPTSMFLLLRTFWKYWFWHFL